MKQTFLFRECLYRSIKRIRIQFSTLNADPEPDPHRSDWILPPLVNTTLQDSNFCVHGPPRLCFESLHLLNFNFKPDPDLAVNSNADPDPAFKNNADLDPATLKK